MAGRSQPNIDDLAMNIDLTKEHLGLKPIGDRWVPKRDSKKFYESARGLCQRFSD